MNEFINKNLLKRVDGFSLGVFRAIFGTFMVYEILYFQSVKFVELGIVGPIGVFEYDFLEWIQPLPEGVLKGLMFVLLIAAAAIALGVLFKPATIIFTIGFSYLLFLGKGHYNNHFYLFCLIAFYLSFTKADRNFSLRRSKEGDNREVPLWNLQLFRASLFITYFYGGLAKINSDWISCQEPVRSLMTQFMGNSTLNTEWFTYLITFGGLAFDLLIGFLLFSRRTRIIGLVGVVVFNLMNAQVLFNDIGIFPYVMIFSTIVFFDPEGKWIQNLKSKLRRSEKSSSKQRAPEFEKTTPAFRFLVIFMIFQLIFPFRSALLPGDTNWTGIGRKFSWRMKVQSRQLVDWQIIAINKETGQESQLPQDQLLSMVNTLQFRYMAENPVMIWQFAQYLSKNTLKKELEGYALHARVLVRYNGRSPQYVIDPSVDLITAEYDPLGQNDWIMPLEAGCE